MKNNQASRQSYHIRCTQKETEGRIERKTTDAEV